MKGKIEKIWINDLNDGRRYGVLQVNGQKYTVWDNEYMSQLENKDYKIGNTIQFDSKKSGKYMKITDMVKSNSGNSNPVREDEVDGKGGQLPHNRIKDLEIARMSSLKAALYITKDQMSLPIEERADNTLSIARKFEKYIVNNNQQENDQDDLPF